MPSLMPLLNKTIDFSDDVVYNEKYISVLILPFGAFVPKISGKGII